MLDIKSFPGLFIKLAKNLLSLNWQSFLKNMKNNCRWYFRSKSFDFDLPIKHQTIFWVVLLECHERKLTQMIGTTFFLSCLAERALAEAYPTHTLQTPCNHKKIEKG